MARNKPTAKKKRLAKVTKQSVGAPFWSILKKFGKRKSHRWRLNPHMRRNWRRNKAKR